MKSTILKLSIAAVVAGSTTAFAPSATSKQSSILHASFENELGSQKPLGYWDPLNFLYEQDQERFDRLRYVELKHGRISMLAFIGQLVTRAGLHLPGNIDLEGNAFDSYPDGVAALIGPEAIPQAGFGQLILAVGILELFVMKDVTGNADFPGDFRNGALDFGWDKFNDKEKLRKRGIELNNGRAAMMGILGLMVHEFIPGNPVIGLFCDFS